MTRRVLVPAVLLVPALLAPAAGGAPRYCNLLGDVRGDTGPQEAAAPGTTGDVDLVSADVAANRTHLTAAIRVADLTPDDPTAQVQGRAYEIFFSATREHHYALVATLGGERSFVLYQLGSGWTTPEEERPGMHTTPPPVELARAAGVVDTVRNEIRMTVPLTAFRQTATGFRPRTTLTHFGAYATRSFGNFEGSPVPSEVELPTGSSVKPVMHPGNPWDAANGTPKIVYPVGAPSCLPVGR
jgi:hypothetical protein